MPQDASDIYANHRKWLESTRWEQRRDALRQLVVVNPPDLTDLLIGALTDRARGVRRLAAGTLTRLGPAVLDELMAQVDDEQHGAWCAVVLATTLAGRRRLAELPDAGLDQLRRALALPDLHALHLVNLVKALAIGPMPAVGDLLVPLLGHWSVMVRAAASRALACRDDQRLVEWIIEQTEWRLFSEPLIVWLGTTGDIRAIPLLKRLSGFRAWLAASPEVRAAARAALAKVIESTRHIPDAALTRAAPPSSGPSAAALSLWAEETVGEAGEED